jgi:hypothetical protein
MRAAKVDRLRAHVAHLNDRVHEVEMALIQAPRVPRWPRTAYSRWYHRQRAQAIRGVPRAAITKDVLVITFSGPLSSPEAVRSQ